MPTFFFPTHLFETIRDAVPVQLAQTQGDVLRRQVQACSGEALSRARWQTAGKERGLVEASRRKDLAEQRLVAVDIGSAGKGKTKQTGTEGPGGRTGKQGRPSGGEGCDGCSSQRARDGAGPAASEEADKLGSL